jgi:hypothetical protein
MARIVRFDGWEKRKAVPELYNHPLKPRAAPEWAEAPTLVAQTHVPDESWLRVKPHFTPEELVDPTLLVATINAWKRFAIGFRRTLCNAASAYASVPQYIGLDPTIEPGKCVTQPGQISAGNIFGHNARLAPRDFGFDPVPIPRVLQ